MNVDLARIQFAFTSINHFFFVPVTIGLSACRPGGGSRWSARTGPASPPWPRC